MTRLSVVVSPAARADDDEHVLWFRAQADVETATRFANTADRALVTLTASPGIGSLVATARHDLLNLRKWRIPGFPKVLIFYLADAERLQVVRVLHAAQDWLAHLERD